MAITVKKGTSYSLTLNRAALKTFLYLAITPVKGKLHKIVKVTSIPKTLKPVRGIYSNCIRKGINENAATPSSIASGSSSAGLSVSLQMPVRPNPMANCKVLSNRIIIKAIISRV
jgi:hypothetical protein